MQHISNIYCSGHAYNSVSSRAPRELMGAEDEKLVALFQPLDFAAASVRIHEPILRSKRRTQLFSSKITLCWGSTEFEWTELSSVKKSLMLQNWNHWFE
jgi:hypothetical protein